MMFSTLAKRLGEKSGAPALEEAILKGRDIENLECFVWTGRKTPEGIRRKLVRDGEGRPEYTAVSVLPVGLIQYQGKTWTVHRLVYHLLRGPIDGVRLKNLCGNTLCCNPNHWHSSQPNEVEPDEPAPLPVMGEEWTEEELEEWVAEVLEFNSEITREDVEVMEIPMPLLFEVLKQMGKEHVFAET